MPFETPAEGLTPFHVLSVEGATGTGKTFQAVNGAPGRIAIASTDARWEPIVAHFGRENFLCANYFTEIDLSADELFRDNQREAAKSAADSQANRITNNLWNPFSRDYKQVIRDPSVRTVVLDQADEFNEYLRLANFGKLEKNPQIASGPVNMEMKGLVREAISRRKNLVLIHQMQPRYRQVEGDNGKEKSEAVTDAGGNPVLKRRGNKSLEYLIQSFIRTEFQPAAAPGEAPTFWIRILQAKENPAVNGQLLPACDWTTLMSFLAPRTPPEAWGMM